MNKSCSDNLKREEIFGEIKKHFIITNFDYKESAQKKIKQKIYDIFNDEDIKLRRVKFQNGKYGGRLSCAATVSLKSFHDAKNLFYKSINLNFRSLISDKNKSNPKFGPTRFLKHLFEKSSGECKKEITREDDKKKITNTEKIQTKHENQDTNKFSSLITCQNLENKINSTNTNKNKELENEIVIKSEESRSDKNMDIDNLEKEQERSYLLSEDVIIFNL